MLDRLRAQFIVITMALVTTVVIASFAGIVAIEYQHGIKAVHEALDAGIGHDAQAQDKDGERKPPDDDRDDAEDRDDEDPHVEPQAGRDLGQGGGEVPAGEERLLRARPPLRRADREDDGGRDEQGGGHRDEDGAPGLGAAHGPAAELHVRDGQAGQLQGIRLMGTHGVPVGVGVSGGRARSWPR